MARYHGSPSGVVAASSRDLATEATKRSWPTPTRRATTASRFASVISRRFSGPVFNVSPPCRSGPVRSGGDDPDDDRLEGFPGIRLHDTSRVQLGDRLVAVAVGLVARGVAGARG